MLPIVTKRAIFLILAYSIYIHDTDAVEYGVKRAIGGVDADVANYPYQVQILLNGTQLCGGSILNNAFVLTAAHCFMSKTISDNRNVDCRKRLWISISKESVTVRIGSSYRTKGEQIYNVAQLTLHPNFDPCNNDYDVAVLKLSNNLTYGPTVAPIKLPTKANKIINGQTVIIAGWGYKTFCSLHQSDQLQAVTLSVVPTNICENVYSQPLTSRMFCAVGNDQNTCQEQQQQRRLKAYTLLKRNRQVTLGPPTHYRFGANRSSRRVENQASADI
ncbi:trypsin-7-like isoform X2 [Sitophilus oryzae]|uniref:Trypsin-7-like isoform X2 n=1 Tax=Sitophilus oryzae TaxID=7048 RepID=A0A6J2XPR8_SITOR|nr:trypsin-7-like isoform X2 [Sitophilus oryzae]